MNARVLVFGEDETLLLVRSTVLRDRGMSVASTTSVEHAVTVADQFGVVVVCTSAGLESRNRLHHAKDALPQTAFVFLRATDTADPEKWQREVEMAARRRTTDLPH